MDKEYCKDLIFNVFEKARARANHIVFMRTFRMGVMETMNPEERKNFIEALNEMISSGFIKYESGDGGMDLIRLTDSGYREIYKDSRSDCMVAEMLMNEFSRNRLEEGMCISMQYIRMSFLPTLNPVETDLFVDVLNILIQHKFISYEDGSHGRIESLKLLRAGYDFIYKQIPSSLTCFFCDEIVD
ncbi:MAG: hypothetical protein IJU90_03750 [Bacteroidales bacterium]|nr:hypothetical protein [Bacteroidales bacterium]